MPEVQLPAFRCLAALAIIAMVVAPVRAQELHFTRYTAADGLPSSRVLSLAQDASGYIWLGTDSGLGRYDGTSFEPVATAPGVSGFQIVSLAALGDTVVYATADNGTGVIEASGVRGLDGVETAGVRTVAIDARRHLMLAGEEGRVRMVGRANAAVAATGTVPDGCCLTALQDGQGRLWVGGREGLYRMSGGEYRSGPRGLPAGAAVNALVEDSRGRLWIGTTAGLYRLDGTRVSAVDTGTRHPVLSAASAGSDLWFGTTRGALRVRGGQVQRIGRAQGLADGRVNDILVDAESNVWFATDLGVAKWVGASFVTYRSTHGLRDDFVVDVVPLTGATLVATRTGVVRLADDGGVAVELAIDPASAIDVTAVAVQGDRLYVGTDRGLLVRARRGGEARMLPASPVRALLATRDGVLVGTVDGLREVRDQTVSTPGRAESLPPLAVVALAAEAAGRVWAVLEDGSVWTSDSGRFAQVPLLVQGADAIAVDLAMADRGVWVATRGQGAWFLNADGSTSRLTRAANGLASDFVTALVSVSDSALWLCTNLGLDFWRPDEGITHFGLADGLAGLGCSPGAAAATSDGTVWFGTPEGLTSNLGRRDPVRPQPPRVVIRSVTAGGIEVDPSLAHVFSANRNDVRIGYSALSYRDEAGTRFQYRLIGESDMWSRPTGERSVSYVGLGPGEYQFEVQAIGEHGLWSLDSARVRFTVLPQPWETLQFRLAVVLIALLVLGAIFWRRLRQVEGERQALRQMVDKRTRELVEKNALLERMATTDELTGLPNRRFFMDTLQRELRKLTRISTDQQLSLLVIDLDRFKLVNDRYGHATGDAVLRQVASRLGQAVRATDVPARYGGEEFAILLPDTGARGAEFLAEKLRGEVEAAPVRDGSHSIPVTISVGVATIDAPRRYGPEVEADLIRRADEAMYEAKTSGRNRVVVAPTVQEEPE